MITLILGHKGSGKTKRLMAMCNEAVQQSKGNVVFIEKDNTLTYDITHAARLVAAEDYAVKGFDVLYGFIAGMCAGNYDITDIFVDSVLKIAASDQLGDLEAFVEKLSKLDANIVMSVSAAKDEIPARIADLAVEL